MDMGKKVEKQSVKVKKITVVTISLLIAEAIVLIGLIIFNLKTQSRYNTQEDLTDYAIQYKTGSQNLTNAVRSYAVTGNIDYYNAYYQELNVDKNRDNALSKLQEIGLTKEEQSYIDQISQTSNNLVPLEEAAMKAVQEGRMEDAREAVYGQEYEASLLIINSLTDTFIESMKERIHKGVLVMGVIALIFDAICFIVLGIVIFTVIKNLKYIKKELISPILIVERQMDYIANGNLSTEFELEVNDSEIGLLAKSIHNTKDILKRVIGEISSTLKEMAKGRFDLTLHENYIGELSEIKQSFEEIFDELNDTFYQIQTAANHVNESSSQMAEAAQDLAEGTTNQASVVEEILASMNTIEDTIEEDAKEAKKSADVIADIGDSLGKSYEMLIHLKNIIDEMNKSSEQIGGIINTINDIASETDLLALNAAIEAARAGEAGKSFAVVAEQVKNLANASSEAAQNTTVLIESSLQLIQEGTKMAEVTAMDLNEVMSNTKESVNRMVSIAESSQIKITQIREVTEGVNQIAVVVEMNSATAEETAASSQEQSSQAEILRNMIERFKINGDR
jgi:methyl-accepting chemotaxis protein